MIQFGCVPYMKKAHSIVWLVIVIIVVAVVVVVNHHQRHQIWTF